MKLLPATTWPSLGLLCLCACTRPYFVGDDTDTAASDTSDTSTSSGGASDGDSTPTTSGPGTTADTPTQPDPGDPTTGSEDATSSTGPHLDLGVPDREDFCVDPHADCDADDDGLAHALGLDCDDAGINTVSGLAVAGPPMSRRVVGQLGDDGTFAPKLGSRAVLLSTGVADHVLLTQDELIMTTECSQIGLPCPATDFPKSFDLVELPAPMLVDPIVCLKGQPPPGPGDCSQTLEDQWLGDPRTAHDYTELRLSAEVPNGALAVELTAAFFTAEFPARSLNDAFNDFFFVWLESEPWTGNIAIHPDQAKPMTVNELTFDFTASDPELAGFGFEGHGATDWTTLAAPVQTGDTITLVMALFDVNDGQVDTAVLLDDLRWTCAVPSGGPSHP